MFRSLIHCDSVRRILALASSAVAVSWLSTANAQTTEVVTPPPPPASPPPTTVVVQPPPPPVATTTVSSAAVPGETRESGYFPNPYLLTTGLIVWGASYSAAIVVAAQSSNPADQHLYIPIVGPWIDLADRAGCPVTANSCNTETGDKVLLAIDGAFQAIGTLEVLWGFLRPVHREVVTVHATRYTPEMTFLPARVAGGYGLTALARF